MRFRFGLCLVLAVALVLGTAAVASAYQGFDADVVSVVGQQTTYGRIFVSGDKMRLEKAGMTAITRMDKQVVWLLMPRDKMYIEQAFRPENIVPASEATSGELERTPLGKETVNGRVADKYLVTVRLDGKRTTTYILWLAADSALPLKTAAEDGSWRQEYRNVVAGVPDPARFEIPDGYKKFAMGL